MAFVCPICTLVSHHPRDEEEGYCGGCHAWTAPPAARVVRRGAGTSDPALQAVATTILLSWGLKHVRWFEHGRYAAVRPLLFTHAIIAGRLDSEMSIENQWCFHTHEAARDALAAWDGSGEPEGWHRHPDTGRRRPGGDAQREEIRA